MSRERDKILIVDDTPQVLSLISTLVGREGREIIQAATKTEGVEKARTELPDLILFDIELPDGSGLDAVKELQSDPLTAGIPILILSSHPASEMAETVKKLGAGEYMEKRQITHDLVGMIEKFIKGESK